MKNGDIKEILDAKFSGLRAELKSLNDIVDLRLEQILEHNKEQNGKIKKLEDETRIWRLIHRNPKICIALLIFIIAGCLTLYPLILKVIF